MCNTIKIDLNCVLEGSYIMVYPILHALPAYGKKVALVEILVLKITHKVNLF